MRDDRIINDIENLGIRRLVGCLGRLALLLVVCGIALGMVVRETRGTPLRIAVMFAVSGLILGVETSLLTESMRKLLKRLFVVVPVVAALLMFALRTLYGWQNELPLLGVIAPVLFSVGFVAGQYRR